MKRKYYQLIFHDNAKWQHYAIHEALIDTGEADEPYWIGSKAIRKYDSYHTAVDAWAMMEPMSAYVDILNASDIEHLYNKVDYSEEELNFED